MDSRIFSSTKGAHSLLLAAILLLLAGCTHSAKNLTTQHPKTLTTVKGIAYNAKGGAIILDKAEVPYYIEGMFAWPDSLLERRVSVSGKLLRVNHSAESGTDGDGNHVQAMAGEQLILQDAKYERIR